MLKAILIIDEEKYTLTAFAHSHSVPQKKLEITVFFHFDSCNEMVDFNFTCHLLVEHDEMVCFIVGFRSLPSMCAKISPSIYCRSWIFFERENERKKRSLAQSTIK